MGTFLKVDVNEPVQAVRAPIDWSRCILCQTVTDEKLACPANSKRQDDNTIGYSTLSERLKQFADVGDIPFGLNLQELGGDKGLFETFVSNKAVWHRSCYASCSTNRLARARKRREAKQDEDSQFDLKPSPVKTRKLIPVTSPVGTKQCIYCDKDEQSGDDLGPLIRLATKKKSEFIKAGALALRDRMLMAKSQSALDLIAQDTFYHVNCDRQFRNKLRSIEQDNAKKSSEGDNVLQQAAHTAALQYLVTYIEEVRQFSPKAPIFKLSDLAKLYSRKMKECGVDHDCHSTRLKEKLLQACSYLEASGTAGQDVLITYKVDVDFVLRSSSFVDQTNIELFMAAKVIRKDIFSHTPSGNYSDMSIEEQKSSVPRSLLHFVQMCLDGPESLKSTETDADFDQAVMTISQLIFYQTAKRRKGTYRRHDKSRETPVTVYNAMKIYGSTRKKDLVDNAHKMGTSISYDRLQTIMSNEVNKVCELAQLEKVVCPSNLKKSTFTTAQVDNLDCDTSATTANSSFHGTVITLAQQNENNSGIVRILPNVTTSSKQIPQLPEDYSVVLPCFLNAKHATCSPTESCALDESQLVASNPFSQEKGWLDKCLESENCIPWAAYHAQEERLLGKIRTSPATIGVMPIFREPAHTMAMMLHTMNVTKSAIDFLNPGQTVVIAADQPLYALLKQIQFLKPDTHGDRNFFIMFGGLHIEMWTLRTLGDWLDGSGWTSLLAEAEIYSKGRSESMIHATNIRRTRYVHEVTAAVLYRLLHAAYSQYVSENYEMPVRSFDEWRRKKCDEIPQFKFWDTTLQFELTYLQFVRANRSGNFDLYVESLSHIIPWFFALDHVNYARWLSVHVKDLVTLPSSNPDLAQYFRAGLFMLYKTTRAFSNMSLDHIHEQVNARLKGDGGLVGLTEDPESLMKWTLAAPRIASMVQKFEENSLGINGDHTNLHHCETDSTVSSFCKHVQALSDTFEEKGNPFYESSTDLYNIETQAVASQESAKSVLEIEEIGKRQYSEFVEQRLIKGSVKLMDPIKMNRLHLFKGLSKKTQSKVSAKLADAKEDADLFGRLYVACQSRDGNLEEFFRHENHAFPPALSLRGEMRSCKKSDLLSCLIKCTDQSVCFTSAPAVTAKLIDGAALVNMLRPGVSRTFGEYAEKVFGAYIMKELSSCLRLDIVWDRYFPDSLKYCTRQKRGEGVRTRVALTTKIPNGWPNFLRLAENKEELFALLSESAVRLKTAGKEIFATDGELVRSNITSADLSNMQPCKHEEADTRLMVHLAAAAKDGHSRILIRTVDTDVVVLAIACYPQIADLEELWISLGTAKNHKYIAVHEISKALGDDKSKALIGFHAYTGNDYIESFNKHGKPSAFSAWKMYPEVTEAFLAMGTDKLSSVQHHLHKFVALMYDKSTTYDSINQCRIELFTRGRPLDACPPTEDALDLHGLRAAYVAGFLWKQALVTEPTLPDPADWGFRRRGDIWECTWTTLPKASDACRELVKCGCKKGCSPTRCSCRDLGCTKLCKCACKL